MLNNKYINYFFLFCSFFIFAHCTHKSYPATVSSQGLHYNQTKPTLQKSLFDFKDRTITEDGIQQILNNEVKLPDTVRIALLNYSSNSISRYYDYYWSNEAYLKLQQSYVDLIKKQLNQAKNVQKIIIMPQIIIGDAPNIFTLRESAVRLQADLLFIFSINSDIYHKFKVFKKDEVKAYATCESLLMDIRTGIIPHSAVITKDFLAKENKEDLNNRALEKRAETSAALLALESIAASLYNFLSTN